MLTDGTRLCVISLGWGVQSWTLAAMVALGELPPVDAVVHSDTTWEREGTYQFAREWTPWLEERGVRVVTVNDSRQAKEAVTAGTNSPLYTINPPVSLLSGGKNEVMIPAMTSTDKGGQLRRQCTQRWKIAPMRRFIASELKRKGIKKTEGIVESWIGITTDEWYRGKDSDVLYIRNRYPLLELGMSRLDCLNWLMNKGLPVPIKSSCTFCPYHNQAAWQELKREGGHDWQQAVEVDSLIRDKRPPFELFLHQARQPLPEAVQIPEDVGAEQPALFDAECDSGYCWT